jgi:phosphotransferase system enzyme I (PtsI)
MKLSGVGSTPLSGVGTARWHRPEADLTLPSKPDPPDVDTDAEQTRFRSAQETAREQIEQARQQAAKRVGSDEAAVFEAHRQFLDDPQLVGDIESAISDGTPAEHAVSARFEDAIVQFEGMDGRMAERADDLRDIRDRLLRSLLDVDTIDLSALPTGTVLLAERLTPSDTAGLDPDAVAGIATVTGGRTSHAAIIARSLAIPAVVGIGAELQGVSDGAEVLVNGTDGTVLVDPNEEERAAADGVSAPAVKHSVSTADGTHIEVAANIGSGAELDPAKARGADGIGLFRTEFLFLDRDWPPSEAEQYDAITTALREFPDNRVVVRTLDIGGDKDVPYLDLPAETNPFLGRRGIRLSLGEQADLFATQVRALLRAAAGEGGDDLAVMFPMVTRIEEIDAVIDRIAEIAQDLDSEGIDHRIPDLGVMIETPAASYLADALAERLDFLSIGTNDLTQYVMAVDRENDAVSEYHDPLHPAVIRAIDRTTSAVTEIDTWVGMCGEMAGDPDLTELLIGLGVDELSMSAVTIPAVKQQVQRTDTDTARTLAEDVLTCETRSEVQTVLDR